MTREEAIRWLTNEKWTNANNKYKKEWNEAFDMAIEALQTEVVRCEDCKWYGKEECSMSYLLDRGGGDEEVRWNCEDDDFCSWGERKGGDSE